MVTRNVFAEMKQTIRGDARTRFDHINKIVSRKIMN